MVLMRTNAVDRISMSSLTLLDEKGAILIASSISYFEEMDKGSENVTVNSSHCWQLCNENVHGRHSIWTFVHFIPCFMFYGMLERGHL